MDEMEYSQKELLEKKLWSMRDGNLIKLEDMKTSHIKACLKAIKDGRLARRKAWIGIMEQELAKISLKEKIKKL